jgi:hypothetical protein
MAVFLINALGETPSDVAENAFFDDVSGWMAAYINRIYELELTSGCDTRRYCPTDYVTRRTAAVFLVRALDETESGAGTNAYFDDVVDHTTTPYVNRLHELGITDGCGTRLFCPDDFLIRDQMAAFLARAFLCF